MKQAVAYFIQQLLKGQEAGIPPEQTLERTTEVKQCSSYVCPDLAKVFKKHGTEGPNGLNSILESRQFQRKNFPLTLVMTDPGDLNSFDPKFDDLDLTQTS